MEPPVSIPSPTVVPNGDGDLKKAVYQGNDSKKRKRWRPNPGEIVGGIALAIAALAASFTYWQAVIARDTEQRQLRAYVGTYFQYIICEDCKAAEKSAGTRNYVEISLQNSGLTPAYNPRVCLNFQLMSSGNELSETFNYSCSRDIGAGITVYPGKSSDIDIDIDAINLDLLKSAYGDKGTLYFFGQVTYRDAFDKERTTPICMFLYKRYGTSGPEQRFGSCKAHKGQITEN